MSRGKYIAIEGLTNYREDILTRLAGTLSSAGLPVKIMREPESQNDLTARAIHRLTHDPRYPMTSRTEVLLYNAARSQSLEVIHQALDQGVTCLVDRSYLTTLVVQYYGLGSVQNYQKILDVIDFATEGMEPDLTIVLDTPATNLDQALQRKFTSEHEGDAAFLERIRAGYLWEAQQRGLPIIYANEDADTVFKEVWQHVAECLATREKGVTPTGPQSVAEVLAANPPARVAPTEPPVVAIDPGAESSPAKTEITPVQTTADEPWTKKHHNGSVTVTDAGKTELAKYVTNTNTNVYSFTEAISPVTIAAAMARLSRRGDDMRVTLLDEFIGKADKDEQLLKRVITAYGDDSVQQLVGHHVVVEGASNLVVKKLEWGRLAAYLEQSTRYIYFDQKDAAGHYKYFIPPELKGKLRSQYIKTLNQVFDLYSSMVKAMTEYVRNTSTTPTKERDGAWRQATKAQACDAIRGVLPVAYTGTVGIYASAQALESLIMHLLADELSEARTVGQELLTELRKVMPAFLERADRPDRGGAAIAYRAHTFAAVKQLANELLPPQRTGEAERVTLSSHTTPNELDIIADILYEHSDMPLAELQRQVATWPYDRKLAVFTAYMGERLNRRQRPGRALEKIHYSFDLVSDYGVFKALQRHRMVDDLAWQELSPRLGYDVPKLIEQAGLTEQFEQCFDLSLQLHSALQASHGTLVAQYAVLQGHNLRWKLTLNAREAFQMLELRSTPQGHPAYRRLVRQMYTKIAEIHPLIADAMIFMNKDEDPELARLAAEKYTQYKLAKLDSTKPEA